MSRYAWFVPLLLATGVVLAEDAPEAPSGSAAAEAQAQQEQAQKDQAKKEEDAKTLSGMSILGNQEAPKALVIVPWKRSELGNVQGISTLLDDSRLPIDKEVFMRMLSYYEITQETARPGGAPAKTNATQPATAAQRRKP